LEWAWSGTVKLASGILSFSALKEREVDSSPDAIMTSELDAASAAVISAVAPRIPFTFAAPFSKADKGTAQRRSKI